MRVDTSGNVGIGTSSPSSYGLLTLQKYSTSAPPYLVFNNRGANTTDASTYTQGGILFTGYRDTNDPAYIASITVSRTSQSGGASSAGDLVFGTITTPTGSIPTERMRIDSSGNVGIGTSSPSSFGKLAVTASSGVIGNFESTQSATNANLLNLNATQTNSSAGIRLQVNSGTTAQARIQVNGDGAIVFQQTSSDTERARIDGSGNLLVGKTTVNNAVTGVEIVPSGGNPYMILSATASTNSSNGYHMFSTGAGAYRFYVGYGGTIFATSTSISAISDQSLKENIRDLDTGLTQVMALRPRRFDWKEETEISEKNVAGFIAQEVEQVLPELVYDYQYNADETKKSLKMGDILPTLVKAIQEQQAMIEELKAKVAALEEK